MYGGHWNILPSNSLGSVIIYSPAFNIHKDMYEEKKMYRKFSRSKRAKLFCFIKIYHHLSKYII